MSDLSKLNRIRRRVSLALLAMALAAPVSVFAQNAANQAAGPGTILDNLRSAGNAAKYNVDSSKEGIPAYVDLVGQVLNAFFAVVGIILIVLVIHAGYLWMSARGNEEQVTKAKDQIRQAIVGFIILMGAYAITYFVLTALNGFSANVSFAPMSHLAWG